MTAQWFIVFVAAGAIALALAQSGAAAVAVPQIAPPALQAQPRGAMPVCRDYDGSGPGPGRSSPGSGSSGQGQGSGSQGFATNAAFSSTGPAAEADGGARILRAKCHDPWSFGGPGATADRTAEVVDALAQATQLCGWLPEGVRIDCLADRLRRIARDLPRGGDYAPVRQALRDAARELTGIARANAAPGVPERRYGVRPPGGGPLIETGPLAEVAPERQAAANAAARAVIDRTETVLLRSTENSRARMAAYQEIAAALDSTKVLLRSS